MKNEYFNQIEKALEVVKTRKITHFYFVACGGSKAFMHPVKYILDRETDIPVDIYSSNEFVHRLPKALGTHSVVVTCSHSGTTPETVRATQVAREKGAITIALSNEVDSPLWKAAEYPVQYEWGNCDASDERYSIIYAVVFGLLNTITPGDKYARAIESLEGMDCLIKDNIEKYRQAAEEFGKTHKRDKLIYTMASGGNYGCAYSFAICLLMEMQWVHSSSIHSGEYFHGPFEITDYDIPFLILKGIDECRPLDERAHIFCKKYSNKVTVIDAADFEMASLPEELRGYFAPIIIDSVLRIYAEAIADHRGHPLSVRRYMWRMEY